MIINRLHKIKRNIIISRKKGGGEMFLDEREQTCCFTGSRPEKLPYGGDETKKETKLIKLYLELQILKAIKHGGYHHFITGMCRGIDLWAAEAVLDYRNAITLECVIPFWGQEERWGKADQERYEKVLGEADAITVLHKKYTRGCYFERNRYMVDHSSLVVAYWDGQKGGTAYTVDYAKKRGTTLVNLYENVTHDGAITETACHQDVGELWAGLYPYGVEEQEI